MTPDEQFLHLSKEIRALSEQTGNLVTGMAILNPEVSRILETVKHLDRRWQDQERRIITLEVGRIPPLEEHVLSQKDTVSHARRSMIAAVISTVAALAVAGLSAWLGMS